ncbi:MAG: mechanosensitive ion channel family protein [Phycisphaerales bacterium JB040]
MSEAGSVGEAGGGGADAELVAGSNTEVGAEASRALDAVQEGDLGRAAEHTWAVVVDIWHADLFKIDETTVQVSQIVIALLMLVLGSFVARLASRAVGARLLARFRLEEGPKHAIQTIMFYVLLFGVVMLSLQTAGVPLTVFTIFGGALALGIGFGSQNVMNNFISGLILLIERPVAIGQMVEVNGDVGKVIKIGARSTHLLGYQGEAFILPNSMLLENTVRNWSIPDKRYRSIVAVGVAYGSDTARVRSVIEEAMEEHDRIMKTDDRAVLFQEFGDNALLFEAHYWSEPRSKLDRMGIESDLRFSIDAKCREAGITIAFPQRDVHLDTLSPLKIRMVKVEGE